MIAFITALIFFISVTAIVCLARLKFDNLFKVTLLAFCIIILSISGFFGTIMADGYRISRGAELFIKNSIADSNKNILPSLSLRLTEEEKVRIKEIIAGLPEKDYKIIFYDNFGDLWEYHIEFENGDIYFYAVEAPNTFLRLFATADYRLYNLRKEKE